MTIYCGVDFHARQQTVCYCDTAGSESRLTELRHDRDDIRVFYSGLGSGVVVGLEASGYSSWFVELLEGLGHQVWLGDSSETRRRARRRQKNDRRDAELILDLLRRDEFPRIHYPSLESRETLRLLCYRHRLVQMQTRAKNSLQALAFSAGSARRAQLLSRKGRGRLSQLPMSVAMDRQRGEWLSLVEEFDRRIESLDEWLAAQTREDKRVGRLRTHPGIGLLTSLALVHSLEPVARFADGRKVTAYVGFDPMEYSFAQQKSKDAISW
jgi:transposase